MIQLCLLAAVLVPPWSASAQPNETAQTLLIHLRELVSQSRFGEAALRIPEATRLAQRPDLSPTNSAWIWNQIALIHHDQGMLDLALCEYRFGLQRVAGQPPSAAEVDLLANLTALYLETGGHPREAELLCQRGLLLADKLQYPESRRKLPFLVVFAALKRGIGDPSAARKLSLEVIDSSGTSQPERFLKAAAKSLLGFLEIDQHHYRDAIPYFDSAISEIVDAYGSRHPDSVSMYLGLAFAYGHLHQWDQANAAATNGLEFADKLGSKSLVLEALKASAEAKRHLGMRREAKKLDVRAHSLQTSAGSQLRSQVHVRDLK